MGALIDYVLDGLALGGLYAVLAMGYLLIYRRHRVIHFAHGDVAVLSAMLALVIVDLAGPSSVGRALGSLLFLGGIVAASLLAALLGYLAYRLIYKPLSGQPPVYILTGAIGLVLFLENLALAVWGAGGKPFPDLLRMGEITALGADLPAAKLLAAVLALVLALAAHNLLASRPGASFLLVGVPAGAAAFVAGLYYGVVWYYLGLLLGLNALVSALAGGLSNLTGVALAGLAIGVAQGLISGYLSAWTSPAVGSQVQLILPFIVLLAVLFLRAPDLDMGLLSGAEAEDAVSRGSS